MTWRLATFLLVVASACSRNETTDDPERAQTSALTTQPDQSERPEFAAAAASASARAALLVKINDAKSEMLNASSSASAHLASPAEAQKAISAMQKQLVQEEPSAVVIQDSSPSTPAEVKAASQTVLNAYLEESKTFDSTDPEAMLRLLALKRSRIGQ